ncbi:unnamed protein product [Prorocentrum cordatum]|uniref:Uncharacterized protein n=1 Tax=Prorocentrum cordatum TaxID=2364126 RepID=A0ABN9RYF7_9DINO|nr:unnamed protein product [Polarella glacialis]
MLAVRGEGLGDSRKPGNSLRNQGRFHFVCKGDADCASKLQPALEKALQQDTIHERVSERMKSGYYERGKGGQAKAERPSLPSAAPHRQGGPPPPGPPPGAWGPPPGAWGPPPPDGWGAPPPGWGAPPPGWPPPPDGWGAPPPGWPPPADGWGAPPPGWVPPPRPMRDYAPDAIAMLRHHGVLDGSFDEDMVADLLDETFGWQSLLDPVQVRPYMDRFLHAASELKVAICGGRAAPSQSRALPAAAPTNAQRPAPAPSSSRPSSSRPSSSRLPQAVEAPAASPEASRAPQLPSPPPPPPLGSGRGGRALPLSSKARGAPPSASLRVAEPVFSERRGAKRPAEKPPLPPGPPPGRGKIFVPSRQNEGEEEDAIEEDSVFVPSDAHYRGGDEEAEDETVEEAGNVFVPSRFQEGDFAQDDVADSVPTYLREYDAGFTTVGDDEL